MAPDAVADEAEKLAQGFSAVKLRLGYLTLQEDLAALHAVHRRLGDGVAIMVDYNQALTVVEALERAARSTRKTSPGSRSRSGTTIMPAVRCCEAS